MWYDYQWIVIVGGISSFGTAYFIGANDVANSFGPSVGAKTLTLPQACLIAGVLEFAGAVLLGGEVSGTISNSIARPEIFIESPEFFAYGMLCALISSTLWIFIATYYGMPVSTTHSIVGSIIGFTLVYGGDRSIVWIEPQSSFPYIKGLVPIIISWFTSPLLTAIISGALFYINRIIITSKNNIRNIYIYSPFLLYFTFFINIFFIFYKGGKNELKWSAEKSAWIASLVSIGCIATSGILYKIKHIFHFPSINLPFQNSKVYNYITYGVRQDIHSNENIFQIQEFDENIENIYKYIQIFSSSCVAFAHGANDVANAIGPFIGILHVYENMEMATKAHAPKWVYVMGGGGIVIGLFTYGYNLIKTIGVQICKITPSRGYCIELATALTVLVASISGIPISTTHCVIGAEIGLGLVEGNHSLNWNILKKTFIMWVLTIVVSAVFSAMIFSQGVYAPAVQMSRDIEIYEINIMNMITNLSKYNDSNKSKYTEPLVILNELQNVCTNKNNFTTIYY